MLSRGEGIRAILSLEDKENGHHDQSPEFVNEWLLASLAQEYSFLSKKKNLEVNLILTSTTNYDILVPF